MHRAGITVLMILCLFGLTTTTQMMAAGDPSRSAQPEPTRPYTFSNLRGTPPYVFRSGEQAVVRVPPGDNLRLRSAPTASSELLLNLADGLVVTVLEGTAVTVLDEEGDTLFREYWWRVRLPNGREGWVLGLRNRTAFLVPLPGRTSASQTRCRLTPRPRLVIGEQGEVLSTSTSFIFDLPGGERILYELAGLERFTVLDGPRCVRNRYYWQVEYEGETGWIEETTEFEYLTQPYSADTTEDTCPGAFPRVLAVGGFAKAVQSYDGAIDVRTRPTSTGIGAAQLSKDEIVEVVDGPLCYPEPGGMMRTWWKISNARGVNGWAPETQGMNYQLAAYDPNLATAVPTPDAACILTTLSGVNLRAGAGAAFEIVGSAALDTLLGADGQALAEDGSLWWRLIDGQGWVAASLVAEGEGCNTLPIVGPEGAETSTAPTLDGPTPTPSLNLSPTPTPTALPTVNPNAACLLRTLYGVNLRAQPRTDAEQVGSRAAGDTLEADAQTQGADFFVWWRLVTGEWVREDLVQEAAGCTSLPVVEAP